jgi:hypothetical protein
MSWPHLALLAAGLMTLACAPAEAHRELLTHDCQGQLHMMSGSCVARDPCSSFCASVPAHVQDDAADGRRD